MTPGLVLLAPLVVLSTPAELSLGLPGLAATTSTVVPGHLRLDPPAFGEPASRGASPFAVGIVSAGAAGVVLGTGVLAWWDRGFTHLWWNDTGFFGRNTYAGGSDKAGHVYSSYVSMVAMTSIYERLGVSHPSAVLGASLFTFLLWNGFEIIDGFTQYGVEYGDMVANTVGLGFAAIAELYPPVDRVVGLRLGYVPTQDFLAHDKSLLKFINDYSGMQFFVDLKLKGLFEVLGRDPGLARYLNTGVVWSTKDYSPVRRDETRERHLGVHVGISLAEVLRSAGEGDEGVDALARMFDFYAVPYLSIILVRELDEGRWMLNFGVANRSQIPL